MEIYRLKREIITDFMKQRMPTLCEVEKPLNWWLSNRIVPNADDLELCAGECSSEDSDLYLQRVRHSALKWWNSLTDSQKKDTEYHTFAYDEDWNGVLTENDIVKMFNDC